MVALSDPMNLPISVSQRTNKVRRLGYIVGPPLIIRVLIQAQSKYNYAGSQYRVTKVKFAGSRKPNRTKKGGGREEKLRHNKR